MTLAEWRLRGRGFEPLVCRGDQSIVPNNRENYSESVQITFAKKNDTKTRDSLTKVELPEVIQPSSLHPSEDVEFGGPQATVSNCCVGLSRRRAATFRLWNAPSSHSWYRLQLQLVEVPHVPGGGEEGDSGGERGPTWWVRNSRKESTMQLAVRG